MGRTTKPPPLPGKPPPRAAPSGVKAPAPLPPKPRSGLSGTTKPGRPGHVVTSSFESKPTRGPVIATPASPAPPPGNRQVVIGSLLPGLRPFPAERARQPVESPCPPPPTATDNSSEVSRLWTALHVEDAHRLLANQGIDCFAVGARRTVAIVDGDPTGHGAYTAALATGDVGTPWGRGTLTGIAPGASSVNVTFVRQPGVFLEPALWAVAQPRSFVDNEVSRGFATTFANAAAAAGPSGVVAFTNAAPTTMSEAEALGFIEQVRGYVSSGGVVVLPGNLFGEVGPSPAVRSALAGSGALLSQPLIDSGVPDATQGQPPTSAVNVAVPTTNGNNSVAVPAVAAVAVLVREANPSLTGAQVTQLLTDPASFDTVQVDGQAVSVLDAARAVEVAAALTRDEAHLLHEDNGTP